MRVRSERHDQTVAALKEEHQAEIEALMDNFRVMTEANARRHEIELTQQAEDSESQAQLALENLRREIDCEWTHALEEDRRRLEQEHSERLAAVMNQHQVVPSPRCHHFQSLFSPCPQKEMLRTVSDQHQLDLRERTAQMAQQKDELHEGDKEFALREAAKQWETLLQQRLRQVEDALATDHNLELESVRRECESALNDLASKVIFMVVICFEAFDCLIPTARSREAAVRWRHA
jgi:hypothetical protein